MTSTSTPEPELATFADFERVLVSQIRDAARGVELALLTWDDLLRFLWAGQHYE